MSKFFISQVKMAVGEICIVGRIQIFDGLKIGRGRDNQIVIPKIDVSRSHGFFTFEGERCFYVDSSRNGTLHRSGSSKEEKMILQSEFPNRVELFDGDVLSFRGTRFEISLERIVDDTVDSLKESITVEISPK